MSSELWQKRQKKFHPLNKSKKTQAQVQVASECNLNLKTEKAKYTSEWSELTELVKKLALCQEEQMAKLSHLESSIAAPFSASIPPPIRHQPPSPATAGAQGHQGKYGQAARPPIVNENIKYNAERNCASFSGRLVVVNGFAACDFWNRKSILNRSSFT